MPRPRKAEAAGSADFEMMEYAARLDAEFHPAIRTKEPPRLSGFELRPASKGGRARLEIFGEGFGRGTAVYLDGQAVPTRYLDAERLEASLPTYLAPEARGLGQLEVSDGPPPGLRMLSADALAKPSVLGIVPRPEVPRVGKAFSFEVRFRKAKRSTPTLVHLALTFPNGEEREGYYKISANEAKRGAKRFSRIVARSWGTMKIRATVYTREGDAATHCGRFDVVPTNPFQVSVFPRYSGLSWKGAAQFDSATGRWYCRSRCVFSNGHDHAVTINGPCTARVTDGGSHVTTFSFDIDGPYTVAANSSLTLYLYTYFRNNSTTNIFDDFGDVTIELSFPTTEGVKSDSAVWVAMGQVRVACNFVGDFSSTERSAVRNLTLGRASSIYEQVDLSITGAPTLEIPRTHGDWGRFRDIRIDGCKNGISSDEAGDMRGGWSSPSSFPRHVDLWFVESFSGASCAASTGGFSPRPGPTSKNGRDSGVVIDLDDLNFLSSTSDSGFLGLAIAHELGHYLGLRHHDSNVNFMAASSGDGSNQDITWDQHNTMDNHGWMQRRNP